VASAACIAASSVVVKSFPRVDPLPMNAIAMITGTLLLLALSWAVGERWALPRERAPLLAVVYLVVVGSVAMFFLYLYVLERWSASATSYQTVLSPLVTVIAGAILAGEGAGILLVAGGALVVAGVYVGVLRGLSLRPTPLK
jgi:drug/metabolite transporter (DMT)-like permease